MNETFGVKSFQCNKCFINTVNTDGLVLYLRDISSHSVEYEPMHFQMFKY